MGRTKGTLIAVDGIDSAAVLDAAREALAAVSRPLRGGVSHWDASGVFHELAMADEAAGILAPRTLLLLYAADLAFRVRWEIRPALDTGRTVVAAPYVDTAVAFGRAAGLPAAWLANLFHFAPRPADRRLAGTAARARHARDGFVGVMCGQWAERGGLTREHVIREMARRLRADRQRRRRGTLREPRQSPPAPRA